MDNITIILAPLQGFTDVTFRNVFSAHFSGIDEAVTPFISTMGQHRLKFSRIRDVSPENNKTICITPQILGNMPEDFIFLAEHLYHLGYDKINWNLGCPHSKIAKKKKGSGLLMYPEMIDAFLEKVMPEISSTLSIKLRLGRKTKEEIFSLLPILDTYPLDEIIIHPRTGIQMYKGISDHEAFSRVLVNTCHRVVYNGDITDLKSFYTVRHRFQDVQRFMIGRGILSNPFLAEEIKKIRIDRDPALRLKEFHDDLFESYKKIFSGPGHLIGRMKGFWNYLGPGCFEEYKKPLKNILKSNSIEKYQEKVEQIFHNSLSVSN